MKKCKKLKIVNLHNNGINRVESLVALASLPRLIGLTLYNCPIYKRNGYRHHTVNTIWSLKALDHYVLSDEEIIEGADFHNTRFESQSNHLKINLNPAEKSMQSLTQLIARINQISKHHSPVIIIQRTVRGYIARSKMKTEEQPPVISASNGSRVLLSPRWRFKKGEVDINYSKLMLLRDNSCRTPQNDALDPSMFDDLTKNDLENGVKGKHFQLNDVENSNLVKKLQDEKIRESTKELNNASIMRKNDLKRKFENAKAKAKVDMEKNRVRTERTKRAEFSLRMKQSLDAARAVDAAYLAKDRQNEFTTRVKKNQLIKNSVDRTKVVVSDYAADYRNDARERNISERKANKTIIEQKKVDYKADRLKKVQDIRADNQSKKKVNQLSEKHAQKFAEYYLRLEKELLKYNIKVKRASTLTSNSQLREKVKHESELGAVKQVEKLNEKLRHWDQLNARFKCALEEDRQRVQARHHEEKLRNVNKIKGMKLRKESIKTPYIEPSVQKSSKSLLPII